MKGFINQWYIMIGKEYEGILKKNEILKNSDNLTTDDINHIKSEIAHHELNIAEMLINIENWRKKS